MYALFTVKKENEDRNLYLLHHVTLARVKGGGVHDLTDLVKAATNVVNLNSIVSNLQL